MKALTLLMLMLCHNAYSEVGVHTEAKIVMDRVHESFVKIIPYIYSEKKLAELKEKKNKDQKEEVIKILNDISNFFKSAKNVETFKKPGFRPSLETINNHMNETVLSVKSDHTSYASKRLKAMTAICISCHTQLSGHDDFAENVAVAGKKQFQKPFDYANYLMLLRKFPAAQKQYENAINENLKLPVSDQISEEISSALKRVFSLHTKIEFNPKAAQKFITQYNNHRNMPKVAHDNLIQWEKSLRSWKSFNPKKLKSIESFISKNLTPIEEDKPETAMGENDVTLLIASGVLTKFLSENPKTKLAPQILYWLAVAEKRLGTNYIFSLGDLYLKECIQLYPESAFAKKCFQQYQDDLTFGFSGSGGTDIPEDKKRELDRLKGLLK